MADVEYVEHEAERRALTEGEALDEMEFRIREVFPDIAFEAPNSKGHRVYIAANYGQVDFWGEGKSRGAALSALWDDIVRATKHPDGVREQWGTTNTPVITHEDGHFVKIPQDKLYNPF